MLYKFSTTGHSLILTLTPDMSINTGNIYRTESLLEHAVSSPISCLVFNLESLSSLNAVGRWTIYQVAYQAKKKGKFVFLCNVPATIEPMLAEAGVLELACVVHNQQELNRVIRGELPSHKTEVPKKYSGTEFPLHETPQQ
jgi:anti-anti-sigma regulatory factor